MTDLVPWDPGFGDREAHRRYMLRWQYRIVEEWFDEYLTRVRAAFTEMARVVAHAFDGLGEAMRQFAEGVRHWQPYLPPASAPVGTRWTSPLDGTRYRMAKGRGARKPPHWVEVAPARFR